MFNLSNAKRFLTIGLFAFFFLPASGGCKKHRPTTPRKPKLTIQGKAVQRIFDATVRSVLDGDTIIVVNENSEEFTVELDSVDAPELEGQEFGNDAFQVLTDLLLAQPVGVFVTEASDSKKLVAFITVGGIDVGSNLVKRGLAWNCVQNSKSEKLAQLELQARQDKVGLWSQTNPVPPWKWRDNQ